MAAFKPGQRYAAPYSEAEFSESKVTGLSRDAYNPGPTPNKYVANTDGKMSIDVSKVDDVYTWPDGTDPSWHVKGGFSGRIQRTGGKGLAANGAPAGNHPSKGTTNFKSRGTDTPTPDQGSPKGGFSWK